MMRPLCLLASALLCTQAAALPRGSHSAPTASTAPTAPTSSVSNEPVAPRQDPWYAGPPGFEKTAPGTILRIRPAPGNLTAVAGNCSAAYHILYRTTNSLYKPAWAVTTLLLPMINQSDHNSNSTNSTTALLSFQIPYDSANIDASPSYALYSDMPQDVSHALGKGWAVSVPDYEGPLASFTAGVLSGHATLDAIRAVLSDKQRFHLARNVKYAMWGFSGGALATEWAAELQVQYAPELRFSGAVLDGLTPNITSVLRTINGKLAAGLAVSSILGISNQYPKVQEALLSKLKTSGTYNKTGFLAARNMTMGQTYVAFMYQNISGYFQNGMADILNPATQKLINSDGIMGYHGVPQFPLFVHKAVHDEISVINDTDKLVAKFCDIGVNILYHRNSIGGHSAGQQNGRPAETAWLESVLNGTYARSYATTGCTIRDTAVNISSVSY